jgi:uncharacterized membrane protein YeaQ/YmgE (transglycosylase-associated protein family)
MTILGFFILLLIAAICGAVGQTIAGYSHGGFLVSTGIGFIGALLGTWIANHFNLPLIFIISIQGKAFPIIWSIIGSVFFVVVVHILTWRRHP